MLLPKVPGSIFQLPPLPKGGRKNSIIENREEKSKGRRREKRERRKKQGEEKEKKGNKEEEKENRENRKKPAMH